MRMTVIEAVFTTFCIGLMMFLLRVLPFAIFRHRKTPHFFKFVEKFIPAISIAVLFAVCLKEKTSDLLMKSSGSVSEIPGVMAAVIASLVTAGLHLWKNNAMISIFGGTILYMILNYVL